MEASCRVDFGTVWFGKPEATTDPIAVQETGATQDDSFAAIDNMHHFMEYISQPSYQALKDGLATEPADRQAWRPLKTHALILAETIAIVSGRAPEKATDEEISSAIDDGVALQHAAADLMEAYGLNQLRAEHDDVAPGKVISADPVRILTLIGAAIAVSCVANLSFYLSEARRVGVQDDDIQAIIALAHLIKQKAASHVDHLLTLSGTAAA